MLTGMNAMAAIVDGVRQRPAPASFTTYSEGDTLYLYNVGANMFFIGDNDYMTRASVMPLGTKVVFERTAEAEALGEGIVELKDFVAKFSEVRSTFAPDANNIWVDNNTEANRFWVVTPNGDTYRINNYYLPEDAESGAAIFMGWKGDEKDTRLYLLPEDAEGACIEWKLVAPEVYEEYAATWEAMKDQFNKAAELLSWLKQAKENGVNVAEWEAVYLNEDATVEDLEAAILAVKIAINDALANGASVANPKDMTGSMLNPNFDNASYDGWKGTAPNMVGAGAHGPANVAEHYNKQFDTYQDLSDMPKGVYMLEATAALRTTWEDHANHTNYVTFLYGKADDDTLKTAVPNFWDAMNTESMAGTTGFGTTAAEESRDEDGTTYYIPSDPSAGRLYFEKGFYQNKVFFALAGDDPLRVGIMKKATVTGSDWVIFDNFKLTYFGNAAEAYQHWINELKKNKTDYGETASAMYLEAYNNAFEVTVTNKAETMAAMQDIDAAAADVEANAALWVELQKVYDEAKYAIVQYPNFLEAGDLDDYLMENEVEDLFINEKTLSNQELQDVIDKIKELIKALEDAAKNAIEPGTDITKWLTNPGFENGTTGWTVVSKGGGNVRRDGNDANHCFEAWHSTNFDVYQEVSNLPKGVYEISVNGYVRYMDGQDAINAKEESYEVFEAGVPIYVYMNDSKTNLVNWFSYPKPESFYKWDEQAGTGVKGATYLLEDEDHAYPDNMTAAAAAFADGGYIQSAKCLVAEKGLVTRIGVKGTPEAMYWPIFDNFKLTYLGYDKDVVKPLLVETIAKANAVKDQMTTKSAKANLEKALADANTSKDGEDGFEMFKNLSALEKAVNAVEEGNALCKTLYDAATELMQFAQTSSSVLANDAMLLGGNIQSELQACELDEAEIEAYTLKIKEMKLKLQLPADYQIASQESPKDLTAFIQTPNFQKKVDGTETNSIDGWEGTAGYNFGNNDAQKSALALEFYEKVFDMYQDIEGVGTVVLPNGEYEVSVNAFERVTDSTPGFLYAQSGENSEEVELQKLNGEDGIGDMVTSVNAFDSGLYLNSLKINVVGNKLRIGIKHPQSSGADWIIMDNFKLTFFGASGEGIENVMTASKPVKVEFFTIDGRRVSAAQKGVIIQKTTMSDGKVVVLKNIRK